MDKQLQGSSSNRFQNRTIGRIHYSNDSLKYSMILAGDFQRGVDVKKGYAYNNEISSKEIKQNKKLVQTYFPNLLPDENNFVFRASTKDIVPPWLYFYSYFIPAEKADNLKQIPQITDYKSNTVISAVSNQNDDLFLILLRRDKAHSKKSKNAGFISEQKSQHQSIKLDTAYVVATPPSAFTTVFESLKDSANYLASALNIINRSIDYTTPPQKWEYFQAAAIVNSMIVNNKNYNDLLKTQYKPNKEVFNPLYTDFRALDYIRKQLVDRQVVMINEQHWMPNHRYLGNSFLQFFYDQGFRYLAVETLFENADTLNQRKYPIQTTGVYSVEPQYGNMLRNAMQMGFTLVPYENTDRSKNREVGQAENIISQTISQDSTAKVLVWAGVSHIYKNKGSRMWMAYHFKELTGIDPLCINQVSGDSNASLLGDHFLAVGNAQNQKDQYDILLYNNLKESHYKIKPHEAEKAITIPFSSVVRKKLKQHKHLLLMIYNKNEFEKSDFQAVPLINYLLKQGDKSQTIKLPKGEYTIILRSPSKAVIEQKIIEVEL